MKPLEHKTYYEVLEVSTDAGADDIKRAYHDALATYDHDALVTYSLFSDEQRTEILRMIERAFDTLIDTKKRSQYNRQLHVPLSGAHGTATGDNPVHPEPVATVLKKSKSDSLQSWVRAKSDDAKIKEMVQTLLEKDRISGKELKTIRSALGVELADIYEITRISPSVLTHIEEDRFDDLPAEFYLKRFIRSYADLLQIEPQPIVDGYLKNMC